MKLSIDTEHMTVATLEHDGQKLEFDLGVFNKKALDNNDLPTLINEYWATLPGFQQQKIFDVLSRIRQTYELVSNTSALIVALLPNVKALYDELDLKRMHDWVTLRPDIHVPERFDAVYEQTDDKPFTRDRTYTRSDYLNLVVLALALRPMVPIWGEFMMRTVKDVGTDFKEAHAFSLLTQTHLMESAAMVKLKQYIKGNMQDEKPLTNAIVGGVAKEDYPDWLLSSVIVRRVSVGDLRGIEQNTNLVVTIHNDLMQKNSPTSGSNFGDPIRKKVFEGDEKNEHGISRLENYKIKATHPQGDIEAIKHYMKDPFAVGKRLMPELNPGLLMQFLESTKALMTAQLWPCQIGLTQWVMAPVIPPRGIYHLDKVTTIRAFAVAQTYLWQHGHKQLAALLTALDSDNSMSFQQTGMGSMARIGDYGKEIEKLFPYNQVSVKRRQTVPPNRATVAIDLLANDFNARDWILTLPDALAVELTGHHHHRRYSCPHEIKQLLSKIAIECAKRPIDVQTIMRAPESPVVLPKLVPPGSVVLTGAF
jgi:hypothetical protein